MIEDQAEPLSYHIDELRQTVLRILLTIAVAMVGCLLFYKPLFGLLTAPLQQQLVILGPMEGIATVCKVCLWTALLISSPIWLSFAIRFGLPALSLSMRTLLLLFFPLSLLFLAGGCLFGYLVAIPFANASLGSFNQGLATNLWSLSRYLDYTALLILANGLAFELGACLLFCIQCGAISSDQMTLWRRHAWVSIFVLSAVLTPPDCLTQLLMALPLGLFYELARLFAKLTNKKNCCSNECGCSPQAGKNDQLPGSPNSICK